MGIPTLLDRIAQEVIKCHLERIVEPQFHDSSYGYQPGQSCHDAVEKVLVNVNSHDWVIDLDIKQFFDTIDHQLLMKAVNHYCTDKWVLMYVSLWLKAGIARLLNPFLRGVISYYYKFWHGHMYRFWLVLNQRLLKWLQWEKGLYTKSGTHYLKAKYKENPILFYHWKWVHP